MSLPTEDEIQRMHRYFAVECNNHAWELAELDEPSAEQKEEMVSLAEVPAWHWSKVGKPINFARADMLLSWVCCVVGWASDARAYTDRVHTKLDEHPEGVSTWDTAFAALLEAYTRLAEDNQQGFDTALTELDGPRAALGEEDKQVFDSFRARIKA